jgi:hypothetical protein
MFFEEDAIKNALKCQVCNKKLDEARNLPCGSTICLSCTKTIQLDAYHHFVCIVCLKKHEMLSEGLPLNKIVSLFLSYEPKEVYRGQVAEKLKSSLKEIEKNIEKISFSLKSGVDQMKEYFMDLKSEVQLATEEAIEQLNIFNEELINEINLKEIDCLASIALNEKLKQELSNRVNESELFHCKWSQYLKQPIISDESVVNANESANSLIINLINDLDALEQIKFNGCKIKFEQNTTKLMKSMLGYFRFEFQSSILTNEQMSNLIDLCGFTSAKSWNLIYRATRDGFGGMDFHDKCDKKKNTFIIIKSTNDNVFGGYTEQDWTANSDYKTDANAFLFSFINKDNKPLVMKCQEPDKAISCFGGNGPIFGKVDLSIAKLSNENIKSWSNLGNIYKHPDYLNGTAEAKSFLAGSYYFQTKEIEVYERIK